LNFLTKHTRNFTNRIATLSTLGPWEWRLHPTDPENFIKICS